MDKISRRRWRDGTFFDYVYEGNGCYSYAERRAFYGEHAFPHVLRARSTGKSRRRTNGSLNIDGYLSILREAPGKGSPVSL